MTSLKNSRNTSLQIAKKLFSCFWPKENKVFRSYLVLAAVFMVISRVITVYMPIFYKKAIDALSLTSDLQGGLTIPVGLLVAYGLSRVLSCFFSEMRDIIFIRLEQKAVHVLAMKVFKHLHSLSLRFHLDRKTGKITRVIERGVLSIDRILRFLTFNIFPTILEILFTLIVLMYMYEASFSIIMIVTMASYIVFTLRMTGWRNSILRKMNQADNDSNTKSIDSLLNYETVKYFSNEKYEHDRFSNSFKKYGEASAKLKRSLSFLNIGQSFIISLSTILFMLFSAYRIIHNQMTIGDFVLINTYLIQLYIPLGNLGFAYREIKQGLVNLEEVFDILEEKIDVLDAPEAKDLQEGVGEVEFSKVSFSYGDKRKILKELSFFLQPGKTTAIVGPSGSGKSTIARLLCRFYDVTSGSISIDGQNIKNVTQSSLRKCIGVVPQDTVLFNETLKYNIAYAKPGATKEEIIHAAEMAELGSLIKKLPAGYETLVGERGLKLSGGEKQRLAIARIVLKNPEIFLFDEATSSLDTTTEKEIQKNILKVSKGKTTIIIAHRLSTIVKADEILVLVNGEIREKGSHNALLCKKGIYAKMWENQKKEGRKVSS